MTSVQCVVLPESSFVAIAAQARSTSSVSTRLGPILSRKALGTVENAPTSSSHMLVLNVVCLDNCYTTLNEGIL